MGNFIIQSTLPNDLEYDHLHGSTGVTEKIKKAMYDAAKEFVYIGFLLWEVKEYKYHWEGDYANVYEYAEAELGFKRSSTKNFIAIAETFGTTTKGCDTIHTMSLQKEYSNYNYSQLTEMLSMSAAQREKASPEMTVKQLRELKKETTPVQEPEIDFVTLDKAIALSKNNTGGQTSGQYNITVHDNNQEKSLEIPLRNEGCSINSRLNASLKEETLKNLCEIAGIKFTKNKEYHIVIYSKL